MHSKHTSLPNTETRTGLSKITQKKEKSRLILNENKRYTIVWRATACMQAMLAVDSVEERPCFAAV